MMLQKIQRLSQLKEWGYNTPKIMQIDYGTTIDSKLLKKLRDFAGIAEKMTIRTYNYKDELIDFKTDFYPEIPTEEAIEKIQSLVTRYNVLFQEAIDVNTTLITGNIALKRDESGFYDILKGRFRVRDVDKPPSRVKRLSERFEKIYKINDSEMREIIFELKDIPLLVPYDQGVIIEFDLHEDKVGEREENLILWEYRHLG